MKEANQKPVARICGGLKKIAMSMKSDRAGTIRPQTIKFLFLKVKIVFLFLFKSTVIVGFDRSDSPHSLEKVIQNIIGSKKKSNIR